MKTMLLVVCCFIIKISFAAHLPVTPEGTTLPKPWKLNKKEFLTKFSQDDSSRALIQFYFYRRHFGIGNFSVGAPLALAAGGTLNTAVKAFNNSYYYGSDDDSVGSGFRAVFIAMLLSAGIALMITGGSIWIRYSRSRLFQLLSDHAAGKPIPRGIARTKTFKGFLRYGEWNYDIRHELKMERKRIRAVRDAAKATAGLPAFISIK